MLQITTHLALRDPGYRKATSFVAVDGFYAIPALHAEGGCDVFSPSGAVLCLERVAAMPLAAHAVAAATLPPPCAAGNRNL